MSSLLPSLIVALARPAGLRPLRPSAALLAGAVAVIGLSAIPATTAVAATGARQSVPATEQQRVQRFEQSLRPAVTVSGQPDKRWSLAQRMAWWQVPGVSIAVIRDGRVAWAKGYGVLQAGRPEPIDIDTVFSVGSVSKVGAATTALRLVNAGRLDLDRDVNGYLTRWQVPASPLATIRPVTLRGLLSHSAGLSVHGFADYQPGEALPTTVDVLEGRKPAKSDPVRLIYPPGTRWQYSGGGTTVAQLVIEETTGQDFASAARAQVLQPLGMTRSSYQNPLPEAHGNIAKAHGSDGQPRALPRGYEAMPENAASGLWSSPSDYAKLVIALIDATAGRNDDFLSAPLARQMMTEVGPSPAGLGPFLEGRGLDRRFSHSGGNDSYRAWMEGHLATGNGMVIFTNGTRGDPLFREIRRAVAESEGWSTALDYHEPAPAVALSAREVSALAGVYLVTGAATRGGLTIGTPEEDPGVQIIDQDGRLYRRVQGDRDRLLPLTPLDTSHFIEAQTGTVYRFDRDYDGKASGLVISDTGGDSAGEQTRARRVADAPVLKTLAVEPD